MHGCPSTALGEFQTLFGPSTLLLKGRMSGLVATIGNQSMNLKKPGIQEKRFIGSSSTQRGRCGGTQSEP